MMRVASRLVDREPVEGQLGAEQLGRRFRVCGRSRCGPGRAGRRSGGAGCLDRLPGPASAQLGPSAPASLAPAAVEPLRPEMAVRLDRDRHDRPAPDAWSSRFCWPIDRDRGLDRGRGGRAQTWGIAPAEAAGQQPMDRQHVPAAGGLQDRCGGQRRRRGLADPTRPSGAVTASVDGGQRPHAGSAVATPIRRRTPVASPRPSPWTTETARRPTSTRASPAGSADGLELVEAGGSMPTTDPGHSVAAIPHRPARSGRLPVTVPDPADSGRPDLNGRSRLAPPSP